MGPDLVQWLHRLGLHLGAPVRAPEGPAVDLSGSALDLPSLLALAAALGWASGFRLYAAVFLVGLAGQMGAELDRLDTVQAFGEAQGRYLVTTAPGVTIPGAIAVGTTGGTAIAGIPLADLRTAHEGFFPKLMQ